MISLILTVLPAQRANYHGLSLNLMEEKISSWSVRRLTGAGVAAQGGRALSGIDLRKGPVVPRQIQRTSSVGSGSRQRPEQAAASLG